MDFSKGLLAKIRLTSEDYTWIQKSNYENVLFRCRACFDMHHLARHFLKAPPHLHKDYHKSTWLDGEEYEHYTICRKEQYLDTKNKIENEEA